MNIKTRWIAAIFCFAITIADAQVNLSNGLVAYYPFNGNALDYSGNGNNGIPGGSAAPTTDQWGNANSAYNFNGTVAWGEITIPNSPSLQFTTACSFSFWVKLNSITGTNGFGNIVAGGDHCIFAKEGDAGGGLWCNTSLTSGGAMNTRFGNVSMTTCSYVQSGISTGLWQHFAYIMGATEQRMYINGVLVNTVPGAPNFATMNTKNLMLARYASNWYPMNGALDEFRVYNRALTPAEVTTLATGGVVTATATNISPATVCAGQQITVDITASGTIANGNTYTVQVSDANGVFSNPVIIGSQVSNAATTSIVCTIPEALPSGTGYKLRVLTNTPVSVGSASTGTFTVNGVLGDIPSPATFRYIGTSSTRNYFISTVQQTWTNARTTCISNGGILAYVPDMPTNNMLAGQLSGTGAFIGYTDQVTEGTWVWEGGNPSGYTKWASGEPNNSGNEDFAQMYTTGFWNDINGTATRYMLCQLNAATSNTPVCSGNAVTLFGATLAGASYQWNGPNGFSSTQQNPVIVNATLADAGTYTLTLTKGGCSATVTTVVTITQAPNNMGQSLSLTSSLNSGLVLYYPFNGNANDGSGNGLNGTMMGGVTTVADRFGNSGGAIQLNGTNGYVDAPDGVYFTGGDFTVSCWIRANSYGSWARVFDFANGSANNNVLLAYTNGTTGRPSCEVYNGTVSGGQVSSTSVQTGTNVWSLLVYTYSGGIARIYKDGTQIASGNQAAPQNVLRTMCYIGRSNWSGDAYANATLDEFRIYNRVLTTTEIQNMLLEQPDAMNLVAVPASVCPNTASSIKVIGSQKGVSYQLQNASTSTNIGTAQNGNCDTLSFATGNLSSNTTFQVLATGPGGCAVTIGTVTVNVVVLPALPVTTSASRCEPGSVTLSASGAPVGGVYNWYTSSSGGSPFFTGASYTTPTLSVTTTYYVSILFNGCETGRSPVTATINLATAPAVDLYTGLIVHYKFDGNTADSSGRGNHANLNWSGAYVFDRFGQPAKALQPSPGAYVDAGNPWDLQALTNQVTLSLWIYETNPNWGFFSPLMNKWQNNGLYMGLDNYYDVGQQQQMNRVRWRINSATYVNSSQNVPYNTWHHIVCTYNGSRLKIYQNGVQTGDIAYVGTITNTITNFQIGRQANGLGNAIFEGIYDEGRVYNRALNQDEVLALYNNGMVAFSNSPVCEGNSIQLSSPFISGATYSWTGPNSFTSSQQIPAAIANAQAVNAGVYTLVITNPNGCVSGPQTNTVVVNPLPSAPSTINDTVCGSGNAVLTASGVPAGGSYQWFTVPTGGTPISGQSTGTYTINNLTATDTFYVTIVSASGCISSSRTPVIAVFNNPMVTNMTVTGSTICDDIASTNITLDTSQAGVIYQAFWNSTAVSAATNGNSGVLTIPVTTSAMSAGTNVITVIATQPGCGNANISDTTAIIVNALPNATITPSGPTTFCSGDSVILSVAMSASYLWNTGETTQTIVADTTGSYSVVVTNASGCSATSSPVSVNVVASPVATISAGGPTTFCQGDNVTLTAGGGSSYLWSNGATTSSITVSTSGNYSVVVSNGSCEDTSATISVTVNAAPAANITSSGPTTFCSGDSVILFASPADSYLWSNGATTSSIVVNTSGTYSVINSDINGCSATSSPVNVNVLPPPVATLTASGPTNFCQGGSVTLSANGGTAYIWSDGSTAASIVVTQPGNYYVIASNGSCEDTSASINVVVHSLPNVQFSTGNDTFFCATANPLVLTGGSPAGGIYSGPGITGNTFDPAAAGTGYITLTYTYTDSVGCSNSANTIVYVDLCLDAGSMNYNGTLMAYPNPTSAIFTVQWNAESSFTGLTVYNSSGQLIYSENVEGKSKVVLDSQEWAMGIYMVELSGPTRKTLKIIRE